MVRLAAAITIITALVTAVPYAGLAVSHASRAVVAEARLAPSMASEAGRAGYVCTGWFARRVSSH